MAAAQAPGDALRARYHEALARPGFCADAGQAVAIERFERLRAELLRPAGAFSSRTRALLGLRRARKPPRGIYLWGGVGRGKTWVMDLFFASLPFADHRRLHFHRFMHDVHAALTALRGATDPLDALARRLGTEIRVLGLDELNVTDIADAMILGALFKALRAHGVTLVITANRPPAELYPGGLQRQRFLPAIALLERHLEVLALDGPVDYRLRALTRAPIYLDSSDLATPGRLTALFETLGGPAALGEGPAAPEDALEVGGRRIPIVGARARVVWFEFAALCEGARSQEDYLELARRFRAVILSGVPVFDAASDDAARRFIALVDEFYDRGIQLIVSAAAAPQELYRGERLAFDFRRTASRLIEMQAEAYLARTHRP
jgi:cell division protein ZapE